MNKAKEKFFAAMHPRELRATAIVTTIAMLRLFALFALLPVMALFAGGLPGATPTLIGVAVVIGALVVSMLSGAIAWRLTRPLIAGYDLYLSFTGGPTLSFIETEFGSPLVRPL